MRPSRAFICGCRGERLGDEERRFFSASSPWGFILFRRNIATPEQTRRLVAELRESVGWNAPVLIDQEGGRVARLQPPHWRDYPAARRFGELAQSNFPRAAEALELGVKLMAQDVASIGADVICLPVLDILFPETHEVIGDRAYADDAELVAQLGGIAARALLDMGVLPVGKHVPGHGRARTDSHKELPQVDASEVELQQDFIPFRELADLPMMMTAHILYRSLDAAAPATFSAQIISDVIRGHIGFDGLLLSDDLSMKALQGDMEERARKAVEAGCDMLLHCNGEMDEMQALAGAAPMLTGRRAERAQAALVQRKSPPASLGEDAFTRLETLLS